MKIYTKENKALSLSLAGLMVLIAVLYVVTSEESIGSKEKSIYKADDLMEVDKIKLRSKKQTITLLYNGEHWKVNNKYNADNQMIKVLFATLEKAQPKRSVSKKQSADLRKKITVNGILVSLFKGKEKLKEFYVSGDENKKKTYFQDIEHGPHIVAIPGYHVYVAGIFELDELGWRSRRVFDFNWHRLKKVSSIFLQDTTQSFEVQDGGIGFTVMEVAQTDTARLNNYLHSLSTLTANQFITKGFSKNYDSLIKTVPQVQIKVSDVTGKAHQLTLYPRLLEDQRMLAKKGDTTMLLFRRSAIDPVLKGKSYFTLKKNLQ